jgi:acyl-CoA thioesterase-1
MRAWLFVAGAALAVNVACGGDPDDGGPNEPNNTLAGDDDGPQHQSGDTDTLNHDTDDGPPPVLGPLVKICPMGDSITAGTGEQASYRRPLWLSLQAAHANVDFVGSMHDNNTGPPPFNDYDWDNEGHGGYRADELADRLVEWILEYDAPDVVLLHIGTNDLLQDDSTEGVLGDIERLIGIIRGRNPHAIIMLAQIIGMTTDEFTTKARALNQAMPAFVAAHTTTQSPIHLVDQMDTFTPATMTYDGTHPDDGGEAEMASVWFAALKPILNLP